MKEFFLLRPFVESSYAYLISLKAHCNSENISVPEVNSWKLRRLHDLSRSHNCWYSDPKSELRPASIETFLLGEIKGLANSFHSSTELNHRITQARFPSQWLTHFANSSALDADLYSSRPQRRKRILQRGQNLSL